MVFCLLGSQVSMGLCPSVPHTVPKGFQGSTPGWDQGTGPHCAAPSPSEPTFVGAYAIPDTYNPHDDKVYIFFRETAMDAGQWEQRHIHARVARVCKVSFQGQHPVACCPARWAFTCFGPRSTPVRGI